MTIVELRNALVEFKCDTIVKALDRLDAEGITSVQNLIAETNCDLNPQFLIGICVGYSIRNNLAIKDLRQMQERLG